MWQLNLRQLRYLVTALVCGLIFLIPSNLFLKFGEETGYVNGLLVDYLLPKVYISDLVLIALIGVCLLTESRRTQLIRFIRSEWLILVLTLCLMTSQLMSPYPLASTWFLIKVWLFLLGGLAVFKLKNHISQPVIHRVLALTLVFQSLMAVTQFLLQKSVASYLFFGETTLSSVGGIAKASFSGVEKILPYGTTAHPNILAGTLVVFSLLLMKSSQPKWWFVPTLGLALVTLILTQSQSAWLALGLGVTLIGIQRYRRQVVNQKWVILGILIFAIVAWLLPGFFSSQSWSWQRRQSLNQASLQRFVQQPFFGTGLNTNAALNERVLSPGEITRFAQPAHHALILILSETGIVGLVLVLIIVKKCSPSQWLWLAGLSPLLFLDHYLLTLQTGQLLLMLSLVLITTVKQSPGSD